MFKESFRDLVELSKTRWTVEVVIVSTLALMSLGSMPATSNPDHLYQWAVVMGRISGDMLEWLVPPILFGESFLIVVWLLMGWVKPFE